MNERALNGHERPLIHDLKSLRQTQLVSFQIAKIRMHNNIPGLRAESCHAAAKHRRNNSHSWDLP
jgi:hypothetical protein